MGGRWRVRGSGSDIWLVQRGAPGEARPFDGATELSSAAAVGFLDSWFPEGWGHDDGETTLRSIGLALGDASSEDLSDATRSLKRSVKIALRDGRLVALRPAMSTAGATSTHEEAAPMAAGPELKKTWIKIKIVDDATGKPVSGVALALTLPNGERKTYTSAKDGLVAIDSLDEGTCDVSSHLPKAKLAGTLSFVSLGEKSSGTTDAHAEPIIAAGSYIIARVKAHKVKAGETLDEIAKKSGSSWQDLATFNWGTSSPDAIDKHLVDDVGCTNKSADKKSHVFDDADKPGVLFVPKPWDEGGLATGKTHTLRVKKLAPHWIEVRLLDEDDWAFKNVNYTLTLPDGKTQRKGKLDDLGRAFEDHVGAGDCKIAFPDFAITPELAPSKTHEGRTNFRVLGKTKLPTNKRSIVEYTENLTYVVHGTVPMITRGTPVENCIWSQPNGRFSRAIQAVHPGVYRCGPTTVQWINWGGQNEHAKRVAGGRLLATSIRSLMARKQSGEVVFNKIDLVAHSHGGNVALEALNLLADTDVKVNNVILIATPQFRIKYKNQIFGSKKAPPDWWLHYRCDGNTKPHLMDAITGKLFNVYSREDAVQNNLSDVSDGLSDGDIPQTKDFRYEIDSDQRWPPACVGAVNCPQNTDVGSQDAHSVLHNTLMGGAIGRLLEGKGWDEARKLAGVPDTINDDDELGD